MYKFIFIIFLLSGVLANPVSGQNDTIDVIYGTADPLNGGHRLFESDELLELTLQFDINAFQRRKSSDEYMPALLTCYLNNGDTLKKTITLRARGNNRKTVCSFPPVRINFKKSTSSDDEFAGIDKLKMVTHCEPGNQICTLKEYLAYKLYNVLTDYSYKVRLARIKYINTARKSKEMVEYAFFIEPTEMLSKRLNAVEVENIKLTQRSIVPGIMDRMAIFNYMIGNTDWSLPIYHNVTVLYQAHSENSSLGIIIPYDFDYAGLINAGYAVPYEGLELKSVLERKYLGMCRSREVFLSELKEFADKKAELMRVIDEFPYLNPKTKKEMVTYLESFFNGFEKRNSIVNRLLVDCITL